MSTDFSNQNLMEALTKLVSLEEAKAKNNIPQKEVVSQTEANLKDFFDKFENENQKITKSFLEEKEKVSNLENNIRDLELKLSRLNSGSAEYFDKKSQLQEVSDFMYKNKKPEQKNLRTDINSAGGYFVRPELATEIIKNITEISPVRSLARVQTLSSNALEMIVRTSLGSTGPVGERQATSAIIASSYGKKKFPVKGISATVQITREEIADANIDIIQELINDAQEQMALDQGKQFVNGDSSPTQAEGFMTNADVGYQASGSASAITPESLIRIQGQIATPYSNRGTFAMNRRTIAEIRALRENSGSGGFLFNFGNFEAGKPATIGGVPYVEMNDMPDIAANSFPVIFADWTQFYCIGIRNEVEIIRDDITAANIRAVNFYFWTRFAGGVMKAEAGRKLKIATS